MKNKIALMVYAIWLTTLADFLIFYLINSCVRGLNHMLFYAVSMSIAAKQYIMWCFTATVFIE